MDSPKPIHQKANVWVDDDPSGIFFVRPTVNEARRDHKCITEEAEKCKECNKRMDCIMLFVNVQRILALNAATLNIYRRMRSMELVGGMENAMASNYLCNNCSTNRMAPAATNTVPSD